ncbi:MAG TPA: hypothetical protein PKV72_06890, partial [Candidatus Peribacteria bacterium]|nr:hypothetical protein [Candidatus Peribacteria bacterium]
VGLAIAIGGAIITIVITTAAEAWSDLQRARFLHDAPPFLFAVWNSTQALGKPTHEMMKSLKEVSWWRHIILGNVESIRDASVQAMYPAIEKKLAFQLFKEEMSQYAPEVFAMVMQDAGGPVAFDTFFTSNTGFGRIYDFWGTELGAITGKNMNDRGQRADAVGDSLATRRAMRYAVARHMIARNAEQHPAAVKRAADAEAVARSRDPLTFAQVEPFVSSFPEEDRAELLRNTQNPVYLRQAMEALVNHLEIQADMLQAHNVDVEAMNGSWRTDSAERMRLYRAAFKDPLICHQLQREYQDFVPDGDANQAGGGLLNAVRTTQLVAAGLPQDNWELARMHLLGIGGRRRDIDALLSPQVTESVARQQLTSHISNYVGTRPNGRYARVDSTLYFPRTTDARERPSVYLSYPDRFMVGAQEQVTAKCRSMCAIADEFPGLTNSANMKMKAVAFNVVPIRAHRVRRTSRGLLEHPAREEYDETHYLINATYYLENQVGDNKQTIIATKGAYLYQNGANT